MTLRMTPRMTPRRRRGWRLAAIAVFISGVALVVLTALNDHLLYFMTPHEVLLKKPATSIRLGGIVEKGSLHTTESGVMFHISDAKERIPVRYPGIVPDLFREGQGVIAEGTLSPDGAFTATRVLAKHDENYMPREVAEALGVSGQEPPHSGAACDRNFDEENSP